jgi:hypothetical protein
MTDSTSTSKVKNSLVILKSLLEGHPVKMGDYIYMLDDDQNLCVQGFEYNDKKELEWLGTLLKVDYTLGDFLRECDRLTFDEVFLIGANTALKRSRIRNYTD